MFGTNFLKFMQPKRILVVDDERHMQRLVQYNLQKTGCLVETAGSGEAALVSMQTHPADLIVIDVMMPGLDGFATVRQLRAMPQFVKTPIIMLTSRGQADIRDQASDLGISLFLTKPFSPLELITETKRLLGL